MFKIGSATTQFLHQLSEIDPERYSHLSAGRDDSIQDIIYCPIQTDTYLLYEQLLRFVYEDLKILESSLQKTKIIFHGQIPE